MDPFAIAAADRREEFESFGLHYDVQEEASLLRRRARLTARAPQLVCYPVMARQVHWGAPVDDYPVA